jgi:hypothetical protein
MSRTAVMAGGAVVAVIAIAIGFSWKALPAPSQTPELVVGTRPALGLRLTVESAGADEDAAATVRVFDVFAARRSMIAAAEQAAGRTWKGSQRAAVNAAAPATPPANWVSLVTFTVTNAFGTSTLASTATTTAEPNAAVFVVKTRPGDRLIATLTVGGERIASNVATIATVADNRARTIAQGRVADALGRAGELRVASQTLLAANPNSPWGDYFRGAALEIAGDRPAARAAFQRALTNSGSGYEPATGLLLRIERLR